LEYNGENLKMFTMTTDNGRKHLPPYVSYRTFRNFIDRLQQQKIPQRIDRSYWGDILSGSTGTQLMAALRFLKLIDTNGRPTERLNTLVPTRGDQRSQLLRNIASEAFGFVLKSNLDLESATYSQLVEAFQNAFQVTDDVSRKCVKFFISLVGDAGMPISPYITRRTRSAHAGSGSRTAARKAVPRTNRNAVVPQGTAVPNVMEDTANSSSLLIKLIDKFPNFDPSWNDDLKLKWITTFDELFKKAILNR
jgi:hypothetical protein